MYVCGPREHVPLRQIKRLVHLAILLLLIVHTPAYAQSVAHTSADYDLHFTKGVIAFDLKEYVKARDEFSAALQAKPGESNATYQLARSQTRLKAYAEAERLLLGLVVRDPAFKNAKFDLGVAQFNLEKYEQALTRFAQVVEGDPNNALAYFYQGLTHNALSQFDRSPARFLRSMLLDPDLTPSAQYHSGLAYFRSKLKEDATEAFQAVIAERPGSELAQSAQRFLAEVQKPTADEEPKSWNLSVMVSPRYDDNVILQAPGGRLPEGIADQGDYSTAMFGRGEFRFLQTDTYTIGSSYSFYQDFHAELDEFDVQSHSPALFGTYRSGNIQATLQYQLDQVYVGREAYLLGHSINPMVMLNHENNQFTQVQYRVQMKDFNDDVVSFPQNSDRDGTNHLFGLTHFLLFAERQGNARLGYTMDVDDTRNRSWDYNGHRFNLGITAPPVFSLRLDATFDYYIQNYLHTNEFSEGALGNQFERRDDIITTTLSITKPITSSLSVGLQYLYNRNQSNVQVFDFNRSIYSLNLTGQF